MLFFKNLINRKITTGIFYIFCGTKCMKSGMHFILTAHFRLYKPLFKYSIAICGYCLGWHGHFSFSPQIVNGKI